MSIVASDKRGHRRGPGHADPDDHREQKIHGKGNRAIFSLKKILSPLKESTISSVTRLGKTSNIQIEAERAVTHLACLDEIYFRSRKADERMYATDI
jgi:hypothetical protein